MTTLEQLVALRDALFTTITNLEMGLLAEKKKADEYAFFRNDKKFDQAAMDAQAARSLDNIKEIEKVLNVEKEKLKIISQEIDDSTKLVKSHGSFPCLLGSIPHSWNVLSRHPSGQFQHRVCTMCGSDEKVGYNS